VIAVRATCSPVGLTSGRAESVERLERTWLLCKPTMGFEPMTPALRERPGGPSKYLETAQKDGPSRDIARLRRTVLDR